jgi:triacylglycerol esterase/lipase EstA (alpha/beta hydrolase family)
VFQMRVLHLSDYRVMLTVQCFRISASIVIILGAWIFVCVPVYGGGTCAMHPSDTAFGLDLSTNSIFSGAGASAYSGTDVENAGIIYIPRVVGLGTTSEFNGDGTLANWQAYVDNGIISADAWLYVGSPTSLGDTAAQVTSATITINGKAVATVVFNQSTQCVYLPGGTQYLKFAPLTQGQAQPDCAANPLPSGCSAVANQIGFIVGVSQDDLNADPVSIGMGTLTFQAMAPIVMVHGWNSGPYDFGSTGNNNCKANSVKVAGQLNFAQAFVDAHAPFDCSIDVGQQVTIDSGARSLQAQLKGILGTFGVRHVNLIGHSKGGLFIREFLQLNADDDPTKMIGVISATTLDTPHRGSVLATMVANFNTPPIGRAVMKFIERLGIDDGFLQVGADDLTPQKVNAFNQSYPSPPETFTLSDANGNSFVTQPQYFSTSADADQDNDRKISTGEASPYPQAFANFAYQVLARGQAVSLLAAGRLIVASAPSSGLFNLNDCLVSIGSAQYPGSFTQINSYVGDSCSPLTTGCGRNHTSIREPDVATFVLQNAITLAQNQQPAQ